MIGFLLKPRVTRHVAFTLAIGISLLMSAATANEPFLGPLLRIGRGAPLTPNIAVGLLNPHDVDRLATATR